MGLIVDSTVFIAAERRGLTARETIAQLARQFPGERFAISAISLLELAHGVARADSQRRMDSRQRYLDHLIAGAPVYPVTIPIALRAGRIDGECTSTGIRIPVADLLIGTTAIELGFSLATGNSRHFRMIPDLVVIPL